MREIVESFDFDDSIEGAEKEAQIDLVKLKVKETFRNIVRKLKDNKSLKPLYFNYLNYLKNSYTPDNNSTRPFTSFAFFSDKFFFTISFFNELFIFELNHPGTFIRYKAGFNNDVFDFTMLVSKEEAADQLDSMLNRLAKPAEDYISVSFRNLHHPQFSIDHVDRPSQRTDKLYTFLANVYDNVKEEGPLFKGWGETVYDKYNSKKNLHLVFRKDRRLYEDFEFDETESNAMKDAEDSLKYYKTYGASKEEVEAWCELCKENHIVENYDVTSEGINVKGSVGFYLKNDLMLRKIMTASSMKDEKREVKIRFKFKDVGRLFDCSYLNLTTLKNCPDTVGLTFFCNNNALTSLEGGPSKVGRSYFCQRNYLTDLVGMPKEIAGDVSCQFNALTDLKGLPTKIGGNLDLFDNPIVKLDKAPNAKFVRYPACLTVRPKPVKRSLEFNDDLSNALDKQ